MSWMEMSWMKVIWKKENYPLVVIVLGFLLIFASAVTNGDWSEGPDTWLTEWTAWVTSYVGLAVAAYAIVKLGNGAEKFLENCKK